MVIMSTKKIEIMIDDTRIVAELYADLAPEICGMLLSNPGQRAVIQHAKLNGQLIFGTLPYPCGFENQCRGGDLDMFDLAYYPPRCQLCIPYGVCTDEPLPISKIGRIIEGKEGLQVMGIRNWLKQGSMMTIVGEVK